MMSMLDDIHQQFIEAVAKGRKLKEAEVKEFADGRIFSGRQAQEAGLVDRIGGFQAAFERAAEKGNIRGEPRKIEYGPQNFFEWFFGPTDYSASMDALARQMLLNQASEELKSNILR